MVREVPLARTLLVSAAVVSGWAFAQTGQSLILNGQASSAQAIVVDGKSYVPVSALQALGIYVEVSGDTLRLSSQAKGGPTRSPRSRAA